MIFHRGKRWKWQEVQFKRCSWQIYWSNQTGQIIDISFSYGDTGQSKRIILILGTLWFPDILFYSLRGLVCGVPGWVPQAPGFTTQSLLAKEQAGCSLVLQNFTSLRHERWSHSSPSYSSISSVWPGLSIKRDDYSLENMFSRNFNKNTINIWPAAEVT